MVKTCDKKSLREIKILGRPELVESPVKQAGELYLEYLEREHKRKKQQEQPGLYSHIQEDYFR
jgi:hypothetical protein